MDKIKVAAVQMPTVADKMENVRAVKDYLDKLKDYKPDFVVLPEMFCCPYQTSNFPVYAEKDGGPVWTQLSEYARQYGIYLIGGSVPEKDDQGSVYNTSYIFDRQGKQTGKHRKVHLFDIDIIGGQNF
ncbi:putative amidohydrolase / Omega amidase [Anaerovibrio sp. JC8]|nr:putative amidohydrolase / Omega amidase [Anaerovibrio sp. JC8]